MQPALARARSSSAGEQLVAAALWRSRRSSTRRATPGRCAAASALANACSASMCTSGSRRSPSASASCLTSRSTPLNSLRGKHGAKISSTARSRREATRMSCTRSMSLRVEHALGLLEQLARRARARSARRPAGTARTVSTSMSRALAKRSAPARELQDHALAQAATADPQRHPESAGGRVEHQYARGQQLARARAPGRGGGPPRRPARRRARASARSSAGASSTGPTSVGSEAALPPTATAWSSRGTSARGERRVRRGAHRVQVRARRRVARGSAAASTPRADRERPQPGHAAGHRADRDLGRHPADVDDRDRPGGRRRRACAWRRRTRAAPRRRRDEHGDLDAGALAQRGERARRGSPPAGSRRSRRRAGARRRRASAAARWAATTSATSSIVASGIAPAASIRLPMRVNARSWSTATSRPCAASATSSRVVFDPMSMQAQRMDVRGRLP